MLKAQGTSVSTRTILHCLNMSGQIGLHKKCSFYARLNFAKSHLELKERFADRDLWSDETKIDLFDHNHMRTM